MSEEAGIMDGNHPMASLLSLAVMIFVSMILPKFGNGNTDHDSDDNSYHDDYTGDYGGSDSSCDSAGSDSCDD